MVINIAKQTGGFFERTQTVTQYYADASKYKVLSNEEENECFEIYHDPNSTPYEKEAARDKVIKSNLRFVISAANQFSNNTNYLDVIQVGNIALINTFERFDPSKGVKFITFAAYYIHRDIRQYLTGEEAMIRQTNSSKTSHLIAKARNKFIQENEREPNSAELMAILEEEYGVSVGDENDLLQVNVVSIDESVSDEDDDACIGDMEEFNSHTASFNDYEKEENNEYNSKMLSSLMSILTPRQKEIISLKYGIGYERAFENDEIAKRLGLTTERIRQLVNLSVDQMKDEWTKRIKKLK